MVVQSKNEAIKKISLFRDLDNAEVAQVANLCEECSFAIGESCQTEGQPTNRIHLILEGTVGAVVHVPNVTSLGSEIILDTLRSGDAFGWSALIKGTPFSTLRVLEPTKVLYINADDLVNLCETNNRIGYILMRNLASLVASRLKRNRMSILNTIVAIRGDW